MKKKDYEYDYKFDWVLKKAQKGQDSTPAPVEDYKQKLRQKLEGRDKKKQNDEDEDEEMDEQ